MTAGTGCAAAPGRWLRRARPLLGTLVEVGVWHSAGADDTLADAAFDAVAAVQSALSRFDPASDIARFNALGSGASIDVQPVTQAVLGAAAELHDQSSGLFDISLGSAASGWALRGSRLVKRHPAARLDLGGIGKGHAVDCAVQALRARGCRSGWINAGGDLRAFGSAQVALRLRDEAQGGVRDFARLSDGSFATSHYSASSRSRLAQRDAGALAQAHASVAAPLCLWADALTKVVAASGDASHRLLARYGAQAWLH